MRYIQSLKGLLFILLGERSFGRHRHWMSSGRKRSAGRVLHAAARSALAASKVNTRALAANTRTTCKRQINANLAAERRCDEEAAKTGALYALAVSAIQDILAYLTALQESEQSVGFDWQACQATCLFPMSWQKEALPPRDPWFSRWCASRRSEWLAAGQRTDQGC